MKPSSAKAKGRRAAQEVRQLILNHFSSLHADDVRVTSSGVNGEDIMLSRKARDVLPVSIECKNVEALNIWKALEQCETNANEFAYLPLLFFRRNRSDLYVALRADEFMAMMSKLEGVKNEDARKEKSAGQG